MRVNPRLPPHALPLSQKVAPGELTLVTGVPNSGKSEWLDALAARLALAHGWRAAVCSLEKRPRDHARQLVEKLAGKPMLRAPYAGDAPRMTQEVRGAGESRDWRAKEPGGGRRDRDWAGSRWRAAGCPPARSGMRGCARARALPHVEQHDAHCPLTHSCDHAFTQTFSPTLHTPRHPHPHPHHHTHLYPHPTPQPPTAHPAPNRRPHLHPGRSLWLRLTTLTATLWSSTPPMTRCPPSAGCWRRRAPRWSSERALPRPPPPPPACSACAMGAHTPALPTRACCVPAQPRRRPRVLPAAGALRRSTRLQPWCVPAPQVWRAASDPRPVSLRSLQALALPLSPLLPRRCRTRRRCCRRGHASHCEPNASL